GLLRYDENSKKNYDLPYKTVIRQVTSAKQALDLNLLDSTKKTASLSYGENSLRFEYAAPFYEHEGKTKYQTWLEGFEKSWSDWGNNTYKEYTNLPQGEYHF